MNGSYRGSPNGNYASPNRNPYGYDNRAEDDRPSSQRRQGGYGGLGSPERQPHARHLTPDGGLAPPRNAGMRRSGDYRRWSTNRERSSGRAEKQIEDILRYIKETWPFMAEGECVPVQVALQLLDDSSLGLAGRYREFQDAQTELQRALRGIVNEHHQGFNSSIGTFHQIQASIQSSHDRVRALRDSLEEAKSNLTTAKPEFKNLTATSQNYANMLEILGMIENVQQVPERLEAQISEKRFLTAVDTLQEGLTQVSKPELEAINALSDIRVYLKNQEISLTDILTEELQNHLYLKSPYCENRWMVYAKQSHGVNMTAPTDPGIEFAPRQMFAFLDELDTSVRPSDDASRNPEADSFEYIYLLAESLNKLGCLDEAIETIEQRMPVELFNVVEKTNNETHQRHPTATVTQQANLSAFKSLGGTETTAEYNARAIVLNDLTQTLYAKFEAIAESHRVLHEVLVGISRRELGYNKPERTNNFKGLWNLYQSEIRTLLHDYLSTHGNASHGHGFIGEGNIFRYQREKSRRPQFKMEHLDQSDQAYKLEREEIVTTWQKFVPGLVSLSNQDTDANKTTNGNGKDASLAGHKLLVEASVFNISCLLPTSVLFLNRLKEIVPSNSGIVVSTLSSFLNDFLLNVFHPQLEETMTDFCAQSFTVLDAFQQDMQWDLHSQKPVFKGTTRFFNIVVAFCRMLDDLTHDQMFSQLVITQMNTYYDRCVAWYKALVTRAQPKPDGRTLKAAALLAEDGTTSKIVQELWSASEEEDVPKDTLDREIQQLLSLTRTTPLDASDLMSDRKVKGSLCLLYTSMKWLAAKLSQLRHISDKAREQHSGNRRDSSNRVVKRSLTSTLPERGIDTDDQVYLPLSEETATLFDGLINAFNELAALVMRTLHLELRCQMIQSLSSAFTGSYIFEDPIAEPDEGVMQLINEIIDFDKEVSKHLQEREYSFLTLGSCSLLDDLLLLAFTRNINTMNNNGCAHMNLNTKVLHQTLQNLERQGSINKAPRFLELFEQGPDAVITEARSGKTKLPPETLKALLRLRYSEDMESRDKDKSAKAGKSLNEHLAHLG